MTIHLDTDEWNILTGVIQAGGRPSPMGLSAKLNMTVFAVWSILGDLYRAGVMDDRGQPVPGVEVVWCP